MKLPNEPSPQYYEAKEKLPLGELLFHLGLTDKIPDQDEAVTCPNAARHGKTRDIEGPTLRVRDNGYGQKIYYCERCGLFGDHASAVVLHEKIRDPERKTKLGRPAAILRVIEMAESL